MLDPNYLMGSSPPYQGVFGGDLDRVRHALVDIEPGFGGQRIELWASGRGCAVRVVEGDAVAYESFAYGPERYEFDYLNGSAIVRVGFHDLDRLAPLRPVLEPAWAVLASKNHRVTELGGLRVYRRVDQPSVGVEDDLDLGIEELVMDDHGRPRSAVIGGVAIRWNWVLDEFIDDLPPVREPPQDMFTEGYRSRLSGPVAIRDGVTVVADFDYQSSTMDMPHRHVAVESGGELAEVALGRAPFFRSSIVHHGASAYWPVDDTYVSFEASSEDAFATLSGDLAGVIGAMVGESYGSHKESAEPEEEIARRLPTLSFLEDEDEVTTSNENIVGANPAAETGLKQQQRHLESSS